MEGVCVCVCADILLRSDIDIKVDTKGCVLDEDVDNLRFDLGVEISPAETEQVLVTFRSTPEGAKKRSVAR